MNGTRETHEETRVGPRASLDFSDTDGEEAPDDHGGDYSTRFDELMNDAEGEGASVHEEDEDEEEAFLYSGKDAEPTAGYRERMRDLLGSEHEDDELDERAAGTVLNIAERDKIAIALDDEARVNVHVEHSPAPSTPSTPLPEGRALRGSPADMPTKRPISFIHPTISRLRSATPQPPHFSPSGSAGTLYSHPHDGASATPSHFSALSRSSSVGVSPDGERAANGQSSETREVFRWTQLREIGKYIYSRQPLKASSVLGVENVGSPAVLATNGLICVGTDAGKVLVFDFKQNLKCICGTDNSDRAVGSVTAVALSFDHTFVASGHSSGHIQLYDLSNPKTPARFVAPTTPAEVASGRQEGHIAGSRIVSIGFVAGRHTAVVSADDSGLSFYHSLGKVLFMDASDTLRLLGKYPDEELAAPPAQSASVHHFRRRKPRKASTILAMAPLPLGTTSHSTEQYSLVAMLTPIKLVIVGLKPSPKTWYRRHREVESTGGARSKFKGTLAWFPSITPQESLNQARPANETAKPRSTIPMLVHSWGDSLFLIRVSETKFMQPTRNARTGKVTNIETGRVVFEEMGQWTASGDILALQWLNVNQVVVLTTKALEVYDIRSTRLVEHASCDAWQLVSPVLSHTTNGTVSYPDAVTEVAHSFRVYKGKIFMLCQQELQVGTLLTWADRILSYVENGDFLSAIELTRMYYVGESPGNRNGLPESPSKLKQVVGDKMHELMIASASYAFSEDRMTDGTHVTPDGRGVDRTSLFEGLVKTCVRASIALDDYDFLFEDLFQYYDDNGIGRIFLLQMEAFVLDGQLHNVPPRITQRLIALHEEDGHPDLAERIIWHIDAECLDVNQAITLCQRHRLYDALLYVYTRALKDYVSPVVELIGLVRKVQQFRRARAEDLSSAPRAKEEEIEPVILNAYKIYPYLGNTLTGLSYPSAKPIPDDEGLQAKNDVYSFLFNGRSSVWPQGEGGNLVPTADEENGVEPTFPYTRLLLRFDPEAFLHTLDLAFEDSHLNDETRGVSRLIIVKILLEILSSPRLDREVVTFINIFIARNVPKYPQFIQIPPSALQNILVGLAEDSDEGTREDRQLAAEYLLSAYTPHDTARIIALFEEARFYRILRSWYRQERRWPALLLTFFKDPSLSRSDIFLCVSDVLESSKRLSKGELPKEVLTTVTDHLSTLLAYSVPDTAALLDESIPALHERVVELLSTKTNDADRFLYFRYLLGPPLGEDDGTVPSRVGGPSPHVPPSLRRMYVADLCRFEPTKVISSLRYLSAEFVDAAEVARICEENGAYDAVIWTLNRQGDAVAALSKAEIFERELCNDLTEELVRADSQSEEAIGNYLSVLMNIAGAAVSVCLEQSQIMRSDDKLPLEDFWYTLLRFQIDAVQRVASCCSPEALTAVLVDSADSRRVAAQMQALSTLRSQVQESFTSLLSVSSTKAVSMPRLFKRLLTSSPSDGVSHPTLYAEFRTLFTGMLESYRSDGDMLTITKHLVDRDLFYAIENLVQERLRGWAPSQGVCRGCNESFLDINKSHITAEADARSGVSIIVARTGAIYHSSCLPPDYPRANASSVH